MPGMAARLAALLPRLIALTLIWLLATSTITFAAAGEEAQNQPVPPAPAPEGPKLVVVPDVRRQAYVFAKGILDDGGFAWRVEGRVQGYAANIVATQAPAPGTELVDTGAPTIVLTLERNKDYDERGLPENVSPHEGTKVVLAADAAAPAVEQAPVDEDAGKEDSNEPAEEEAAPAEDEAAPAEDEAAGGDDGRKPDFHVPGAPAEPLDEMPLPKRARLLEQRLSGHTKPSRALVDYWLFQHAWVVTGARFGWDDGAEALRILIRVDEDLQARWGFGAKSEAIARAALAEVESKAAK